MTDNERKQVEGAANLLAYIADLLKNGGTIDKGSIDLGTRKTYVRLCKEAAERLNKLCQGEA